jgi:hypothetical protein
MGEDIVARLRERGEDGTLADSTSQELMLEAADEIERLHERLEDNRFYDKDGNCRNETIKLQDEELTRLRAEVKSLQEAVGDKLTEEAQARGEY